MRLSVVVTPPGQRPREDTRPLRDMMSLWLTVLLAAVGARDLGAHGGIGRRIAGHRQGMLATSNQLGATIGASVETSFSRLEDSRVPGGHVIAALVIGAKLRGIGAIPAQAEDA